MASSSDTSDDGGDGGEGDARRPDADAAAHSSRGDGEDSGGSTAGADAPLLTLELRGAASASSIASLVRGFAALYGGPLHTTFSHAPAGASEDETPLRIFVSGDRSQVGKSTVCLGLVGALLRHGFAADDVAYIKPCFCTDPLQTLQFREKTSPASIATTRGGKMEPQKADVDPTQVKIDNGGAAESGSGPRPACASSKGSNMKYCILQALFVLFVICNVTALYVLHFVNRPSPTTRFTFESFTATDGTSPDEGNAVSLSSSSALRNGAGTTAYLGKMQLSDGDFYEYINFAPLGTTKSAYATNLMSYTRTVGTTIEGVLTTFTVGTTETTKTVAAATVLSGNLISGEYIRGLATLSDTLAVVLSIEPFSSPTYSTRVTPVDISGTTATMVMAKREKTTDYSATNFIAALPGASAFVLAYYEKYDATNGYTQRVKVGIVDPTTKAITFSADTPKFAPDNSATFTTQFGKPVAVGKEGMFIIPYFQTTGSATLTSQLSGLCVTSSTYSSSDKTIAAFSTGVCQTKYMPKYLVDSIMLSDAVMALAFYDGANNNALTVVTVSMSSYDKSLSFRTSYVFAEVSGAFEFGTGSYGFSTKPSLAKLSGNRVAVSFLNPSQNGKQSVKVLHLSLETLTIKDVTPVMPVAKSDFSLIKVAGTNAVDKAVTQEVIAVSSDGVVAAYIGKRGTAVHQRFSVVEDFGAPVGILRKYNGKAKASVAISGKAEVSSKLTVGQVYYATTTGAVQRADTSTGDVTGEYVYSLDGSLLMTTSSKVGIAVDDDKLFVNTAMN